MKLLLDTHLLLAVAKWDGISMASPSDAAVELIRDPANDLMFSAASIWEVAIKNGLGRADFKVDPRRLRRSLLDNGYVELATTSAHAAAVGDLPARHKDPFDRILVAQATVEGVTLLTADAIVADYGGPIRRV